MIQAQVKQSVIIMTFVLHSNVNRRFLSKCGFLSRTVSPLKSLNCGLANRLNWVAILRSRMLPLWGCDVPGPFSTWKRSWPNEVLNATYSLETKMKIWFVPGRDSWDKGICGSLYRLVACLYCVFSNILVFHAWLLTACYSYSWRHVS